MAAPRVYEYIQEVFKDTCIKVMYIYNIDQCSYEFHVISHSSYFIECSMSLTVHVHL